MRELADSERIERLMEALARHASEPGRVYFAGGASAVLVGWRETTIDVDVKIEPESDEILKAIPEIKESLQINIEFATPSDFMPVADDWRERSRFIRAEGNLSYFHFDLVAQALAKLERGHVKDLADVDQMIRRNLLTPDEVISYFEEIESELYKFPSIDVEHFRQSIMNYFKSRAGEP